MILLNPSFRYTAQQCCPGVKYLPLGVCKEAVKVTNGGTQRLKGAQQKSQHGTEVKWVYPNIYPVSIMVTKWTILLQKPHDFNPAFDFFLPRE